jgi:hypothetical protein
MIVNNTHINILAGEVLTVMEHHGEFTSKHELRDMLDERGALIDMGVGSLVKQGLVVVQPLAEDDYLVVSTK